MEVKPLCSESHLQRIWERWDTKALTSSLLVQTTYLRPNAVFHLTILLLGPLWLALIVADVLLLSYTGDDNSVDDDDDDNNNFTLMIIIVKKHLQSISPPSSCVLGQVIVRPLCWWLPGKRVCMIMLDYTAYRSHEPSSKGLSSQV